MSRGSASDIVAHLLAADSRRSSSRHASLKTHPFVLLVLNLFFCGYYHQFLKTDINGHYLTIFILLQSSILVVLIVGSLVQYTREIIQKSIIFPTTPWSRLFFVLASCLRRPVILAVWFSAGIFLGVVFRGDAATVVTSILVFSLMVVDLVIVAALLFLMGMQSRSLAAGLGVLIGVFLFTVLVTAIVFRMDSPLVGVPLVTWTAAAIVAGANRILPVAAMNIFLLIAFFIGGMFIGRRLG